MTQLASQQTGPQPFHRGRLAACTFAHALGDAFANFVPPLWATVQALFGLSGTGLGLVSLFLSITTNFGQPVFGYLVDRYRLRNVIPVALLVATVFIAFVGFMPNLYLFVACLMLGGLGIALFHPRGGALAAEASGSRRAFGMSIFGAGGAIGFAAASLAAPLLHNLGLHVGLRPLQGFIFMLPVGLAGVLLLARYNPGRPLVTLSAAEGLERGPSSDDRPPQDDKPAMVQFSLRHHLLPHLRPLTPLFIVMVLRSGTVFAYATFIQVLQQRLGHSVMFQGAVLFSFVAGAAIGGLIGAHLSDLYGRRFMTVVTLLLSPPLLYYALHVPAVWVLVLLFLAGATLRGAESVNIAQTQDLLPDGMSTASAISMGFTWGIAGFVAPVVGFLWDRTGSLTLALGTTCALPIIAAVVALSLPTRPRHA